MSYVWTFFLGLWIGWGSMVATILVLERRTEKKHIWLPREKWKTIQELWQHATGTELLLVEEGMEVQVLSEETKKEVD